MNGWLADQLGLHLTVHADRYGGGPDALAGLALRRNPRRAHLLVSRVLGKHLPVDPRVALDAAHRLAAEVPTADRGGGPVVIGYCETATALGHAVADGLPGADYLHSTRRTVDGMTPLLTFEEAHSHATSHALLPADRDLLAPGRPVVLVDDELSTGRTALATIRALHAHASHPAYTVATLLDLRPAQERKAFERAADDLGVRIDVVALLAGELDLPPDLQARAQDVLADAPEQPRPPIGRYDVAYRQADWPDDLPDGGRHGWTQKHADLLAEAIEPLADDLAGPDSDGHTLVLGTEELMYVPMRLAAAMADRTAGTVAYHSTTRSPVHPVDRDGYAVRTALTFPAPDEPARQSRVHNVTAGAYDRIVVVVDGGDPAPMAAALSAYASTTVVTVPSFRP